jgi:hypothetical protein
MNMISCKGRWSDLSDRKESRRESRRRIDQERGDGGAREDQLLAHPRGVCAGSPPAGPSRRFDDLHIGDAEAATGEAIATADSSDGPGGQARQQGACSAWPRGAPPCGPPVSQIGSAIGRATTWASGLEQHAPNAGRPSPWSVTASATIAISAAERRDAVSERASVAKR